MRTSVTKDGYASGAHACRITGMNIYSVLLACLFGDIRWRARQGRTLEFHLGDLERIADAERLAAERQTEGMAASA